MAKNESIENEPIVKDAAAKAEKRYVMSFADFGKKDEDVNDLDKEKHDVEDAYSGPKTGEPGVKTIGEEYEMDLDADDFVLEHAKWVLGKAMDNSKKEPFKVDLNRAFNELIEENSLNDPDDDRPGQVKDSLMQFLIDLTKQAKDIKVNVANKPPTT